MSRLPDELLDYVADRFRVLSDANRLRILRHLMEHGESTVGEIVGATRCSQANVSKHLRVLLDARVVRRRPEGTSAYYTVVDPSVPELCDIVCGGIRARVLADAALVSRPN
jgi:DNA-binding transcriptional ArsR family regulator